jgi:hypothetical protein
MAGIEPGCNPPRVPSSDEFKDPFSEETRDGLLQIRQWSNIQDTESTEAMEQGLKCFALFYEISVSFVSLWFRNGPKASN